MSLRHIDEVPHERGVFVDNTTVDFVLPARRDQAAAWRFLKRANNLHDLPQKITLDKSRARSST